MKRYEISEGARAPVIAAGGTAIPSDWREAGRSDCPAAPLKMRFGNAEAERRNGAYLIELVREYVKRSRRRNDEKSIRDLRRLVEAAPGLALVPELLEYIAELLRRQRREAVAHILGGVKRGRKLDQHGYLVAMVDLIKQQEGTRSDAEACRKLRALPNGPFAHFATVEAMRTIYSERRELMHALRSYRVSERELAQVPRDLFEDICGALAR